MGFCRGASGVFFPPCGSGTAPVITPPVMNNESVSSDESHLIRFLNHGFQLLQLTGSHCTQWIINGVTQLKTHFVYGNKSV